ncbi:MAG: PAC2 family protein [Streptosporangiales bacterium]|nr:PAC2 family protein [Streptosporangiales bacterium]
MIELEGVPELVDPILVAAFEGWNDAGDAATGAIEHLEQAWKAAPVAALDPEDYYDFQVTRPTVDLVEGTTRKITWPTTRLSMVKLPEAGRDLVLVRGIEPNMRWQAFCNDLLGVVRDLGAETVVLLGALLADVPHTRSVPITGVASDAGLARSLNLDQSRYEGPTGIVGVLQDTCSRAGFHAVSLWAAVPHYVAQPPCPKATVALLSRLEDILDVALPLDDLTEQASLWESRVDELAQQDEEVAEYVRSLERQKDESELPEASGEAIAQAFERYLRRRGQDDDRQ